MRQGCSSVLGRGGKGKAGEGRGGKGSEAEGRGILFLKWCMHNCKRKALHVNVIVSN